MKYRTVRDLIAMKVKSYKAVIWCVVLLTLFVLVDRVWIQSKKVQVFHRPRNTLAGGPMMDPAFVHDCVGSLKFRKVHVREGNLVPLRTANKLPVNTRAIEESDSGRETSFRKIFKNNVWVPNDKQAVASKRKSGSGSTLQATIHIRTTLDSVIKYIKQVTGKERVTMLDAPCGDMFWMSKFLENRTDVDYTGVDIVPELIQSHKARFQRWKFEHKDVVSKPLGASYDLIHTRHMTQHLITADGLKVLQHFSESGSLFLLASTYPSIHSNWELSSLSNLNSRHRAQNLEIPPFSLGPPQCVHVDAGTTPCYSALWKLPLEQLTPCTTAAHITSSRHPKENWSFHHCKGNNTQ